MLSSCGGGGGGESGQDLPSPPNIIIAHSVLPSRPLSNTGWSTSGGLMKGVPIDLDRKGCLDLISTSDSWSNENEVNNYLFSILNTDCSF